MAKNAWPAPDRRKYINSYTSRLDGALKATGVAKYAYDQNRKGMLFARIVQCPHANAVVKAVDASEAEKMPGVLAVLVEPGSGGKPLEISCDGAIVATVAAETEEIAAEAVKKVKVTYDILQVNVDDKDPSKASGRDQEQASGDVAAGFAEADFISEGHYGVEAITHCCLEPHGQVCEVSDGELYVWPSTQNVSGFASGITKVAELEASKIHVDCQVMGGGFGSKFSADRWGEISVQLTKMTGRPIKLMLERDQEIKIAGARPSAFANIKVGVKKDGTITAMEVSGYGSGGTQRFRLPPIPYVFQGIPNQKLVGKGIITNRGAIRAWRAPNHPQGCLISMSALDDAAAAAGIDSLEFFKKNLNYADEHLRETYAEELDIAAKLIDYKAKAHLRGKGGDGPVKRGLGLSMHTWGGQGHPSACNVTINPDGSVVGQLGTQDLGTGTRTAITMVIADTLGLPMEKVKVEMGNNKYPVSGGSGGSTTIGGVSSSSRDASTQALNALLEKVAPELGVAADQLEAWDGKIQVIGDPSKSVPWEKACKAMGAMAITKQGNNPPSDGTQLTTANVGGVQMADVSVDIETGVVTMNEFVAVQDIGLIIDKKTAESQIFGAIVMGVTYALYEECIYDPATGRMLNPDMEFYRLASLGDVGHFKVHLMDDEKYQTRGVIGLGEPPVISPGAAISNAVANACGVRVGTLPLTPDRVITALQKGGVS